LNNSAYIRLHRLRGPIYNLQVHAKDITPETGDDVFRAA